MRLWESSLVPKCLCANWPFVGEEVKLWLLCFIVDSLVSDNADCAVGRGFEMSRRNSVTSKKNKTINYKKMKK